MNKYKITDAVKENDGAEIAVLQQKFGLTYREVKSVIDELVKNGMLIYESGVKYAYVKKAAYSSGKYKAYRGKEDETEEEILTNEESFQAERRAYLEMRRNELIKKMQADMYPVDESEEDEPDANSIVNSCENSVSEEDKTEREAGVKNFIACLKKIANKKEISITARIMPTHPSWHDEDEFTDTVMTRIARLVKSDKRMGKHDAEKKADICLEVVKDTCDIKMTEVYERVVYEIYIATAYEYEQLKKQIFGE